MRPALALLAVCLLATPVDAGLIIVFAEANGDVTATLSGSLTIGKDREARGRLGSLSIAPGFGVIDFGGPGDVAVWNDAVSGPAFGTGGNRNADASSGDLVGLDASSGILRLPLGYMSGGSLNSTLTFNNRTFSSLGLTSGTSFTYTITTGTAVDTAIVQIGTVVPEPSTLVMAMFGVVAVAAGGVLARRRAATG